MKGIKISKGLSSIIIAILLIVVTVFYTQNAEKLHHIQGITIATFIINGLIIIIGCVSCTKNYSLNKIFWYFSFFFLFLAPLIQYISDTKLWKYEISDSSYVKTNLLLTIWFITYSICYWIKRDKNIQEQETKQDNNAHKIAFSKKYLNIGVIVVTILMAISIIMIGFKNLFIRGQSSLDIEVGFIRDILTNFIRITPVYFLIYSIYYYKKENKKAKLYVLYFAIVTFILNFPISITRYWVGTVYIGIGLVLLGKFLTNKKFDIAIIIIILVVFPLFQAFKWYSLSEVVRGEMSSSIASIYKNVDFDAYSMFARTIEYTDEKGITNGGQIIGTIFFFIPRAIWTNKPVPTGELVSDAQGQEFTNLSCPLPAEGYINFGLIGTIIFAAIIGVVLRKLDNIYWKEREDVTYIDLTYPFGLGLLIFLLRGALHPVVVYMFTLYLPIIILAFYNLMKEKLVYKQ